MADTKPGATLRPMHSNEYAAFIEKSKAGYAHDIAVHGGESQEFAQRKSEEDHAAILPQGLDTPGHWIFVVEADGAPVGTLWLAERPHGREKECYIYGIEIEEGRRGRGYGRTAMELAEVEARSHGLHRIALNVFGGNEVARNLYRSLGYAESAVHMAKELD